MPSVKPLEAERLYTPCELEQLGFETTAEIEPITEIIGQSRALEAVQFGIGMRREGYNLYVMGPPGMGKHTTVRHFIGEKAAKRKTPSDWCYVNNFAQSHKPLSLQLPSGMGRRLRNDMAQYIEELTATLPATFESDEYRAHIQSIEGEFKERQEQAFEELTAEAEHHHIKLFRTPSGFTFAPMKDDEVLGPEAYEKLSQQEKDRIEQIVANLQEHLKSIIQQVPQLRKETQEKVKQLNREVTMSVVGHRTEELKKQYADFETVVAYLDALEQDIIENVRDFLDGEEEPGSKTPQARELHRYHVNLLVDNHDTEGAPVIYLDNPTYLNLVGRADHLAQYGTLITDFTMLKPGALHRANGGYLVIDAHKLLTQPFTWEGLKRALYSDEIHIESLEKMLSLVSTVSLEPQAIPLDVKVVILGNRLIYYLLHEYDPDFAELFKVAADFENQVERNRENNQLYAQLIATLCHKEKLMPFERGAVARVIEFGARLVGDAEKLSAHMHSIADILREADYWAAEAGCSQVAREHVQQAIDHQVYRMSRVKEQIQEAIERGTLMVDTAGEALGQINGLSVLSMAHYSFGQPSRITATVHIGEGHVVDIEREVELGGALHSKGVLILSSFLAARYAQQHPLSLSASLVFEQSYGMVDGDSASLAELCALISVLAEMPIQQRFAVTGSVNQHGRVQPIGGVNEKIEGFFEVCKTRGLGGGHAVIIPASNVSSLMLSEEVVAAAKNGTFTIFPVETVDQALELLLQGTAGERDTDGSYPADSINARVQERLHQMSLIRQTFADKHKEESEGEAKEGTDKADEK